MNPFTQSTVASPVSAESPAGAPFAVRCIGGRAAFSRRIRGPARLLRSLGLAVALAASGAALAVDVNQATLEQLQGVRGIGPKTAQTILDERGRGGPYASFEDLSDRVKGIGSKKAVALQEAGLKIGGRGAAELAKRGTAETGQQRSARTQR